MNKQAPTPGDGRDPELSRLLRSWSEPAALPPRFGEEVWRRIDRERLNRASAGGGWMETLKRWLSRPLLAGAYLALVILAGAGAGAVKGQSRAEALTGALEGRYVQSIDPFHGSHRR